MSDRKDESAEDHCDESVENDTYGVSTQYNLSHTQSGGKGIYRRRFLRASIGGAGLSLVAGCTGSAPDTDNEEESTIDEDESYGFDREGQQHEYEFNGQLEVPFGDSIHVGGVILYAKGIEWGNLDYGNTARVEFEWHNVTNSTLTSYSAEDFSLYEQNTNNQINTDTPDGDTYDGPNQVQPEQADTGYLAFKIPDEYESLKPFKFTLFVPAQKLQGNQDVDVAWVVDQEE